MITNSNKRPSQRTEALSRRNSINMHMQPRGTKVIRYR